MKSPIQILTFAAGLTIGGLVIFFWPQSQIQKLSSLVNVSAQCGKLLEAQIPYLKEQLPKFYSNDTTKLSEPQIDEFCSLEERTKIGAIGDFALKVEMIEQMNLESLMISSENQSDGIANDSNINNIAEPVTPPPQSMKFNSDYARMASCIIITDKGKGSGVLVTDKLACRIRNEDCRHSRFAYDDVKVLTAFHVIRGASKIEIRCGPELSILQASRDKLGIVAPGGDPFKFPNRIENYRDIAFIDGGFAAHLEEAQRPILIGKNPAFYLERAPNDLEVDATYKATDALPTSEIRFLSSANLFDAYIRAKSAETKPGSPVFLVGYPLHSESFSISKGDVTSDSWKETEFGMQRLVISAPAAPGLSGSAVYDQHGVLIGVLSGARKGAQMMNIVEQVY